MKFNFMRQYRNNGAVGALLDEYEKAVLELKKILEGVQDNSLSIIVDAETKDPDCISIQSILNHVLRAGYNYVIAIRNSQGERIEKHTPDLFSSIESYKIALDEMFEYNVQLFESYPALKLETSDSESKILTSWGQRYDVEQLFEHAIVHILRHRRQIQRFLLKLRDSE